MIRLIVYISIPMLYYPAGGIKAEQSLVSVGDIVEFSFEENNSIFKFDEGPCRQAVRYNNLTFNDLYGSKI